MTPVGPQGFRRVKKSVKKVLKMVERMSMKCTKVIISVWLSVWALQTDHFDQKCTFLSKSATEMTPVVPSDSDQKVRIFRNGQEDVYDVHKRDC